jgi:glycosyltransferase involved in cell wall biosynthesis
MKLIVQIPALNEEATIADVIARVPRDIEGITSTTILVIDDGSSDRTGELARDSGAILIRHEQSRGVGAAFRTGIQRSTELGADIIVTIDGDGQFNPEDMATLIEPIQDGRADFVTASRFADKGLIPDMSWIKKWGNNFMARLISTMVGKRFHDVSCGFRAYSRNAYLRLVLTGDFTYTHEVFLTLAYAGLAICEVPLKIRGVREHGSSRVAPGVLRYGLRTGTIILRTYRDYKPLRFFSFISFFLCIAAICFAVFLIYIRITTGAFTPHKWAAFVAATFGGAALIVFLAGIVAEMLDRARITQEESLYRVRKLENELRDLKRELADSRTQT